MQRKCTGTYFIAMARQGQAITSVGSLTDSLSHHNVPTMFVKHQVLSAMSGLLQSVRQRWVRMRGQFWLRFVDILACSDKALSIKEFTMLCQQLFRKPQGAPYQ